MTMGTPATALLVSILFGVTGAYYLVRTVIGFSWPDRISNLTHVPMSIVMVAMPWPWVSVFPTVLQITVFTLAALWYMFLIVFGSTAPTDPRGHHTSPAVLRYHGGMMAAMVWMAVAMSPNGPAMSDTPGMSMSAGSGLTSMTGSEPWGIAISTGLGVLFAIAAIWFILRLIRLASGRHGSSDAVRILDAAASVLMGAGMSIAFLALMI
ncbi:MAG TPA: DUF5134 domain-containing protein [Pseudolysinimonas sp.]|jgi:hypothetical protein